MISKNKAKIVFAEISDPWEKEYLRSKLSDFKHVAFYEKPAERLTKELKDVSALSVFIKSKIDASFLKSHPMLKLITTRSTGFDHIDVKAAGAKKITVCNVPTYGENTVAEHTFALILSISRVLRKAYLKTLQNDFSVQGLMGFDLKGKTLGVIGTGHIGLHVIRIGVGFGMNVLAYDTRQQNFLSEVLNFDYVPLDKLLSSSDIISLHVPYFPETHHMINCETIQKIKRGAILINTARGALVETEALVRALDKGILSGAGLDVLEGEEFILGEDRLLQNHANEAHWKKMKTLLKNHVLLHRENVIYTPHMAFYSKEAVVRILETTVWNIRRFFSKLPGQHVCKA